MKPNNYVTERNEVEINGNKFPQVTIEYWLERGTFEQGDTRTPQKYTQFMPDRRYQIMLIGKGTAFDQKKAQREASDMAVATLAKLGLTKPIPESYQCVAKK